MQRLTSSTRLQFATTSFWRAAACSFVAAAASCSSEPGTAGSDSADAGTPVVARTGVEAVVIESKPGFRPGEPGRPPYRFSAADERLLDDVQRGAFWFLWNQASPTTGMVVDRSSVDFASIAGVGFQLAGLPIGVERGWVTRDQAQDRALKILRALEANPKNRKAGLFYHFLTAADARPVPQDVVSTIDSAIFFCGALTAGAYFGGEVRTIGDRLVNAADWSFFVEKKPRAHEPFMKGFISLGWKPSSYENPTGPGALQPYYWADCGDEHRMVWFLAAAAPTKDHAVDPVMYHRLRRTLGEYQDSGVMVYLPWSGAIFTNFFAHCFMDYRSRGPDDPKAHGIDRRPRVDWWENSRRHVALHRIKAREAHAKFPNLGEHAWGLTACDVPDGYGVPGVYPEPLKFPELVSGVDDANWVPKDDYGNGTLGCYGAGCSIMFEPQAAVAALRNYQGLKATDGSPLVWREPSDDPAKASYGFIDSFNATTNWAAKDYVSIDQGPLLLAIENARTGKVWDWFQSHPWVKQGWRRVERSESR